jgi:hypothetical protein
MALADDLLPKVKKNLILDEDFTADDDLLTGIIAAAIDYAERFQHVEPGSYSSSSVQIPQSTVQAIIIKASHLYESRDGSTGGFYGDNVQAGAASDTCVDNLLRLARNWSV